MIIKLTLVGLIIALIAIVASTYYVNKEGFDNITASSLPVISNTQYDEVMKLYNDIYTLLHGVDPNLITYPDDFKKKLLNEPAPYQSESTKNETKALTQDKYNMVMEFGRNLYSELQKMAAVKQPTPVLPMTGAAPSTVTPLISNVIPDSKAAPVTMGGTASTQMGAPLLNSVVPERHDVVPQVSLSESGYKAMELQQRADLLKDIQKVVKNELLATRSTDPLISNSSINKVTDSMVQGKEYEDSCYKGTENRCPENPDGLCPSLPDMSKYIKKDEIPCYGCTLDY